MTPEQIDNAATKYATMQNTLPGYDPAIRKAFLEGAAYAQAHQWISVKDALPEDDETVLIANNDDITLATWSERHQCWDDDWGVMMLGKDSVDHWMPLPDLPENKEYKLPQDCDRFHNRHCGRAVREITVPNREPIYYAKCDPDCEYFRPKKFRQ